MSPASGSLSGCPGLRYLMLMLMCFLCLASTAQGDYKNVRIEPEFKAVMDGDDMPSAPPPASSGFGSSSAFTFGSASVSPGAGACAFGFVQPSGGGTPGVGASSGAGNVFSFGHSNSTVAASGAVGGFNFGCSSSVSGSTASSAGVCSKLLKSFSRGGLFERAGVERT